MRHLSANTASSRPAGGPPSNDDNDTGVVVETRAKTKRPPLYKVMLLNDDYTPMEFVVHVLERFFGMTHAQAFEIMLTVHKKGVAVVGVFSHRKTVKQTLSCIFSTGEISCCTEPTSIP
ncbi:MAG: ATP-dependent Clp protease adaptor ClpS [Marivita lacus]|nr:ATP-dependent Clp protease adaptor ClpS [Marivita lacus]